jgi:2-polyprenyl-3-methyl-5-hydroxy-6-metoxy-1,4-benzoquinol methylase
MPATHQENSKSLAHRVLEAELMDDPQLGTAEHYKALRGLALINRFSDSAGLLWRAMRDVAHPTAGQPLRVLDIATGGGDVPIRLYQLATAAGMAVQIDACDVSERAIDYARKQARLADVPIHFYPLDILSHDIPRQYDVVMSSLFMHHLPTSDVKLVLMKMRRAARQAVIVNDLLRCRRHYWMAVLWTRLTFASRVVRIDGPLSVRASFTLQEMQQLFAAAGMGTVDIRRVFPYRCCAVWEARP